MEFWALKNQNLQRLLQGEEEGQLLVPQRVNNLKWVYQAKFSEDGSIQKYKAQTVAKGYSQQSGIDFDEIFAPAARME